MKTKIDRLAKEVLDASIKVHRQLGAGLLESAYQQCLIHELKRRGLFVQKEVYCPIVFDDITIDHGYRIDLLVEHILVIELKAVDHLIDVHFAQVKTYLKLGEYPLGLLLNFNEVLLKNGMRRIINSDRSITTKYGLVA